MTGLLSPKSSGKKKVIGHFVVRVLILVVYLGDGIFFISYGSSFYFSRNQFFDRGLELSRLRRPPKKSGTPLQIIAHVFGFDNESRVGPVFLQTHATEKAHRFV